MKIFLTLAIVFASLTLTACGGKKAESTDVEYNATNGPEPVDLQSGANAITPVQLDELILNADDLGAGEAVGALDYLRVLANNASGRAREIVMRKYVDLYGIVLDNHGDELRGSMNQLRDKTGVDLRAVYDDFSSTLRVGDQDGAGSPEEANRVAADSAEITTVNENVAVNGEPNSNVSETETVVTTVGD